MGGAATSTRCESFVVTHVRREDDSLYLIGRYNTGWEVGVKIQEIDEKWYNAIQDRGWWGRWAFPTPQGRYYVIEFSRQPRTKPA